MTKEIQKLSEHKFLKLRPYVPLGTIRKGEGVMVYLTCACHWSGVGEVKPYMD